MVDFAAEVNSAFLAVGCTVQFVVVVGSGSAANCLVWLARLVDVV